MRAFEIRDHGIGIPPDKLDRVFGRFERGVAPRGQGGLGPGLYVAQQIVEAHGGRIAASRGGGDGTTLRFELLPHCVIVPDGKSRSTRKRFSIIDAFILLLATLSATPSDAVHARVDRDLERGAPIVIHVFVALADNASQNIVPVPKALGDGDDPAHNLYWGALYGVRRWLAHDAGWTPLRFEGDRPERVLDRVVLEKTIEKKRRAVLVADAYEGRSIKRAIESFFAASSGRGESSIRVFRGKNATTIEAGGRAHVVVYVGHDGLMDFSIAPPPALEDDALPRSAIVLACASKQYFGPVLERSGAHLLLLTTNLMAPEAYTLDAALTAFIEGKASSEVGRAAAEAYCKRQKCGRSAGLALFASEP